DRVLTWLGIAPGSRDVPARRRRLGGDDDAEVDSDREGDLDDARREEVFLVIEPPLAFRSVETPPVPVRTAAHGRRGSNAEVAADPSGIDDPSLGGLARLEAALAVALLMVIAVRKERTQLQGEQRTTHQSVGHDRPL